MRSYSNVRQTLLFSCPQACKLALFILGKRAAVRPLALTYTAANILAIFRVSHKILASPSAWPKPVGSAALLDRRAHNSSQVLSEVHFELSHRSRYTNSEELHAHAGALLWLSMRLT